MKKIIFLVLLIFIYGCTGRHIPEEIDIIEEKTSSMDHFGDYSYCVKFKITEKNLTELNAKGFSWFPRHIRKNLEKTNWKNGKMPDSIRKSIKGLDVHLNQAPDFSKIYKYIYQWQYGGFWRLVAINKEAKEVYYYRVTW